MFESLIDSKLFFTLVSVNFLAYSIPAWIVIIVRMLARKVSRIELAVLGIFVTLYLLEVIQLVVDGGWRRNELWGFPRYFGVFAPFLWLWTAKCVSDLWNLPKLPVARILCRIALIAALAWVFIVQNIESFRMFYSEGARADVRLAASRISEVIRRDYAGPSRQAGEKYVGAEYFTTRRPVVFGHYGAAAWMVRGQAEGAIEGRVPSICPYPDDYLFIRVGSGYGAIETVDSKVYDYVKSVQGLGYEWRLFRRKTTPHN